MFCVKLLKYVFLNTINFKLCKILKVYCLNHLLKMWLAWTVEHQRVFMSLTIVPFYFNACVVLTILYIISWLYVGE